LLCPSESAGALSLRARVRGARPVIRRRYQAGAKPRSAAQSRALASPSVAAGASWNPGGVVDRCRTVASSAICGGKALRGLTARVKTATPPTRPAVTNVCPVMFFYHPEAMPVDYAAPPRCLDGFAATSTKHTDDPCVLYQLDLRSLGMRSLRGSRSRSRLDRQLRILLTDRPTSRMMPTTPF
jgi:hypothetical protein